MDNKKNIRCDACAISYDRLYRISFGHDAKRMVVLSLCEACLNDMKGEIEKQFKKGS